MPSKKLNPLIKNKLYSGVPLSSVLKRSEASKVRVGEKERVSTVNCFLSSLDLNLLLRYRKQVLERDLSALLGFLKEV